MPEKKTFYFFDSVVLSNFALVHRLDLLLTRYRGHAFVTSEVRDEIAKGISCGYRELRDVEAGIERRALKLCSLTSEGRRLYGGLLRNLGSGEASCIAASRAKRAVVVTDDRRARTLCSEMGIPVTGTLGILVACCRGGTLKPDEADAVLSGMMAAGFHSPVKRLRDIL